MNFAVCGDSWFSDDLNYPNRSFAELLSVKNSWQLLQLARAGMSNFGIALQVDRAIESRADIIIITTTTVPRIEIPSPTKKDNVSEETCLYNKNLGLDNIDYSSHAKYNSSARNVSAANSTILSDTIVNFLLTNSIQGKSVSTAQKQALRQYIADLYDTGTKRQTDSWLISDMCRRLIAHGKPWLLFLESYVNGYSDQSYNKEYLADLDWVDKKYLVTPEQFAFHREMPITNNAIFHYCEKTGAEILADYIEKRLMEQ